MNVATSDRSLFISLAFLCLIACDQATPGSSVGNSVQAPPPVDSAAVQFPAVAEHAQAALTFSIIDAPNGTFGYDILSDGKLFIHQTNIPGQPGNEGCKTREQAEKLAALIVEKMRKGEMPPTVSTDELKALGIP